MKLSEQLGCPVVEVSALKGTGLKELYAKAVEMAKAGLGRAAGTGFPAG